MFGKHFYNKNIRNIVVLFGTVFNDISIKRLKSNGTVDKHFKVPISYGPAQKYLTMLDQKTSTTGKYNTAISLPRMAFEITQLTYDGTRKLQTTRRIHKVNDTDSTKLISLYTPVPYNFDIELSVMVKNSDDGTQILEQILPFFTPEFQVTMNEMSIMGVKRDIPIIFTGMTSEDTYQGDLMTRRSLIHTLQFTIHGHIYGPTKDQGIIKEVDVNAGANFLIADDLNVDVKPDPTTADPDDDYGYTTTIT